MNVIHFGSESEFVEIRLPKSYSVEGWAQADVEIAVNCFHGKMRPWVESADFEQFTVALRVLYDSLQGEAELSPMEEQFTLKLISTGGGHIEITGEAWSQATYENKLEFTLGIDQSYLLKPLTELEILMSQQA
jgi:hypothetical protein